MNITEPEKLSIFLNVDEGSLILTALAEQPFKNVYELIGNINKQANEVDIKTMTAYSDTPLELTRKELELIIMALGNMPFNQVYGLLQKLNQQMYEQMDVSRQDDEMMVDERS